MSFELWDAETRNLVEEFESLLTRSKLPGNSSHSIRRLSSSLALAYEDPQGETTLIARASS